MTFRSLHLFLYQYRTYPSGSHFLALKHRKIQIWGKGFVLEPLLFQVLAGWGYPEPQPFWNKEIATFGAAWEVNGEVPRKRICKPCFLPFPSLPDPFSSHLPSLLRRSGRHSSSIRVSIGNKISKISFKLQTSIDTVFSHTQWPMPFPSLSCFSVSDLCTLDCSLILSLAVLSPVLYLKPFFFFLSVSFAFLDLCSWSF